MKNKITKLILLFIFLIAAFVVAFLNFKEDKINSIQFIQDRIFDKQLVLNESYKMDRRYSVMKKTKGYFYFVSWGAGKIFEFNEDDLSLNRTYGNKGEGPKENLLISRFEVDSTSYATVDTKKYTIQIVNFNDSLLYYYKYPKPLMRSVKIDRDYLLAGWDADFNIMFEKFNLDNKTTTSVDVDDQKLKGKDMTGLVYDGFFVKNKSNVVFVSYSNDAMFCFDDKLNYNYSFDMVYDIPDPRYEKLSDGNLYPSKDNYNCTEDAFLNDDGLLFVLTTDTDLNSKTRIVDVYDISKKIYIYSFSIPDIENNPPEELIVEDETAYVLYENFFAKYTIEKIK